MSIINNKVFNPLTNRWVQFNSKTHKQLIQQGVLNHRGDILQDCKNISDSDNEDYEMDDLERMLDAFMKPKSKTKPSNKKVAIIKKKPVVEQQSEDEEEDVYSDSELSETEHSEDAEELEDPEE